MPRCPTCGKREVPGYDWLFYGFAECRECHTIVEQSRFVRMFGGRAIHLVPLVLVIMVLTMKDMSIIFFAVIGLFGFASWVLFLYFSRPVPYIGKYPIGPSRSDRLLTPVIL